VKSKWSHASSLAEILRHLAESFQDHSVFEFAKIDIAAPRESRGVSVRIIARHSVSAADRGGFTLAFDCLSGSQPIVYVRERQRYNNRSSPASIVRTEIENVKRTKVKQPCSASEAQAAFC
jgi:hypothetical protein